ncbi:glycosyltransferase [Flavobacterium hercynium]|uniref:Glycosyl transferase family 2 n=1 Tax=Flavobacterium hercynium TaxID=387094 RepID=A0A226HFS8_9FLAO|nr:glycosyltransferase [Flavobacterium hercynium]OXA92506.1 glycosyl transferase family 2 [Flavobacterium hercynium]SMP21634.1 Glycosyltransferase, catalytic subunit of cellulose synthase and poly-beta-1,6-N-acetylglucosamine synthase [Flavobacterium hercynium]
MLTITFYFFIAIVVVQLSYYLGIFGKFAFGKPQTIEKQKVPVSVIVCAKNEENNVKNYIPLLAEQDYPDFEIVLIDDASSDETLEVFEEFEQKYDNIRLVKVENNEAFWGNKKYALTLGIKASKKEYLLFTDADCYPTSKDWITAMSSQFTEEKTIILGYGGYERIERSLLNKVIRFETILTAVQYFSWAKIGLPYMGVGRNLAYKKEEFFNVNGFIEHIQVRSGDDDLFVNQAANKNNTAIAYHPDSFTYSRPKKSYSEWFTQKRRHATTANHYKFFDKMQLSIFYTSQLFFFLLVILLLSLQFQWIFVLALLATRYTIAWIVMGVSAGKLKERDLRIWFPIVEIVLIFTQINIFITNIFSKPVHWK